MCGASVISLYDVIAVNFEGYRTKLKYVSYLRSFLRELEIRLKVQISELTIHLHVRETDAGARSKDCSQTGALILHFQGNVIVYRP